MDYKTEFEDVFKTANTEEYMQRIIIEFIQDFTQKYGDKHEEFIVSRIKEIVSGIHYSTGIFDTPLAESATDGIIFSVRGNEENNYILPIVKHELWHIINSSGLSLKKDYSMSHTKIPEYDEILTTIGISQDSFPYESEKWTEYLNIQTDSGSHTQAHKTWNNGFFTSLNVGENTYYENFVGIAQVESCLFSEHDIIESWLAREDYDTDITAQEMIRKFDKDYADALSPEDKEKYKYPHLKVMLDTDYIGRARRNIHPTPEESAQIFDRLQGTYAMLFRALQLKLDRHEGSYSLDEIETIYNEIKKMQAVMPYNVDPSMMLECQSTKEMLDIESRFLEIARSIEPENSEQQEQLDLYTSTVGYSEIYEPIEDAPNIQEKILQAELSNSNDPQSSLYKSIKIVFADDLPSFLLKGHEQEAARYLNIDPKHMEGNILHKLYQKIEALPEGISFNDSKVVELFDIVHLLELNKLRNKLSLQHPSNTLVKNVNSHIEDIQMLDSLSSQTDTPRLDDCKKYTNLYLDRYDEYLDFDEEEDKDKYDKLVSTGYIPESFAKKLVAKSDERRTKVRDDFRLQKETILSVERINDEQEQQDDDIDR